MTLDQIRHFLKITVDRAAPQGDFPENEPQL